MDLLSSSNVLKAATTKEKVDAKKAAAEMLRKQRQAVQLEIKKETRRAAKIRARAHCLSTDDLIQELGIRSAHQAAAKAAAAKKKPSAKPKEKAPPKNT